MCELFCLSSRLATRATFSLQRFAERGGLAGHAIDGWGVALYDGRDARLYKEPEPAADSAWLRFIEARRLPSRLLISHIRHATRGGLTHANTQPFLRELGGHAHVFAHNGRLERIDSGMVGLCRRFRPLGETDSEIAFCLLLERLTPLWESGAIPSLAARLAVVSGFAAELRGLGPANFLYADGDAVFAHGHRRLQPDGGIAPPGLWLLARHCAGDSDAAPALTVEAGGDGQEILLLASVPLSREPWVPLAEGEVIALQGGRLALPRRTGLS